VAYVRNIPFAMSRAHLEALFAGANSAKVIRDKNGHSKGYAFVKFGSQKDLNAALANHDTTIEGRKIEIKEARKKNLRKIFEDIALAGAGASPVPGSTGSCLGTLCCPLTSGS
jgi:RNA recognition motif-containing protein